MAAEDDNVTVVKRGKVKEVSAKELLRTTDRCKSMYVNCIETHILYFSSALTSSAAIRFGLMSGKEMRQVAEMKMVTREIYQEPGHEPAEDGALDPRLGTSSKAGKCTTCGLNMAECSGHFGYLRLSMPCFHIGYFRATIIILQMTCKTCCRVMLDEDERMLLRPKFKRKTDLLTRKNLFKKAHEMAKKHKLCPRCNAFNGRNDHGTVKKDGPIRVTHDAFAGGWPGVGGSDVVGKSTDEHVMQFRADMEPLIEYDPEYEKEMPKAKEEMHPIRAMNIFCQIPDEDVIFLDMDPKVGGRSS